MAKFVIFGKRVSKGGRPDVDDTERVSRKRGRPRVNGTEGAFRKRGRPPLNDAERASRKRGRPRMIAYNESEVTETSNENEFYNEVSESSNEDDYEFSEVVNPNLSPGEFASSFQSVTEGLETMSEEEHGSILEIPKPTSSGVRSITIKFSRRKEDYNNGLSTTVAQPSKYPNGNGHALQEEAGLNFSAPKTVNRKRGRPVKEDYNNGLSTAIAQPSTNPNGSGHTLQEESGLNFLAPKTVKRKRGRPRKDDYNTGLLFTTGVQPSTTNANGIGNTLQEESGLNFSAPINVQRSINANGIDNTEESGLSFSAPNNVRKKRGRGRPKGSVQKKLSKGVPKRSDNGLHQGVVKNKFSKGFPKKRDNDLHGLIFLPNGLPDRTRVAYCVKGKIKLKGYKQGNGIVCSCCDREISPSQFEAHAGWSVKRQPYRHIYTSNGLTLHDISVTLANGQNLATSDDITRPEFEFSGCAICKARDCSAGKFEDRTVVICDLCRKEFHVGCLRDSGLCNLQELPKEWFCNDCNKIHVALQNLVNSEAEMIPALLLNPVNKKHIEKGYTDGAVNDIQWKILSGENGSLEHLPFFFKATAIFRECFDPIVTDTCSDLIPAMVYGREIAGQFFGGMHCVVLIVNSEVVSAGLVRIFGRDVAELPLVATSKEHQGKGYFQAMFSCIERLLCSLNVENLVLPAAEKAESLWTDKLGFQRMSEERLLIFTRYHQLTSFKGTLMLEKNVQQ